MTTFTPREEVLRIAISNKMWVFMDDEHHRYTREVLVERDDFWLDDLNDQDAAMEKVIEKAEQLNLPYSVSDELDCLYIDGAEGHQKDGPIHTMLIEIVDEDYDEDEDLDFNDEDFTNEDHD